MLKLLSTYVLMLVFKINWSRVFHFVTRSLEIVLKFWAPKAAFRRNSVIIDFLVNKLIFSQTKYVVICFTLKPSQPENISRIYFLAVAVKMFDFWGRLKKIWSELQIGLRIGFWIGSDSASNRIGVVFSLLVQIIIFGKSCSNNYTGGWDFFSFEPPVPLIRKNSFSCITSLKIHHQLEGHHFRDFRNCLLWRGVFNLGSVKKRTNTLEIRDGKKQNQSNEKHLNLSPPSSIRKVLHDQVLMGFFNVMNLCNRKFLRAV